MQRTHAIASGVAAAVILGLVLAWSFRPEVGPPATPSVAERTTPGKGPPVRTASRDEAATPAVKRRKKKERRRRDGDDAEVPRPELATRDDARAGKPGRPETVPSAEKAKARREAREAATRDVLDRLDGYGAEAGWDPAVTADMKALFADTSDRIGRVLANVDRGNADWDEVRRELRQFRLDAAAEAEVLLGPEAFEAFVQEMDFQRFHGEEPIRGRL